MVSLYVIPLNLISLYINSNKVNSSRINSSSIMERNKISLKEFSKKKNLHLQYIPTHKKIYFEYKEYISVNNYVSINNTTIDNDNYLFVFTPEHINNHYLNKKHGRNKYPIEPIKYKKLYKVN